MTEPDIIEFTAPSTLDGPDGDLFRQMAELRNVVEAEASARSDLSYGPEELLPHWLDQHTVRHAYLALVDRRAGRARARGVVGGRRRRRGVGLHPGARLTTASAGSGRRCSNV